MLGHHSHPKAEMGTFFPSAKQALGKFQCNTSDSPQVRNSSTTGGEQDTGLGKRSTSLTTEPR